MRRRALFAHLSILALTGLAFWLRVYNLESQSYWIDEAWTLYFANLSLDQLWRYLLTVEPHPPLYFPSTLLWVRLLGDGEFSLRFYSLLFGVLAAPLTYRLGQDLGGARLGLAAALLMAVAPYQIWHAQEARMYAMLTAASATSMWGFVNLWQRGGRRWWLGYVAGTAWLMLTHYHGLVVVGSQGLFLLLTWRRRWRRFPLWGSALLAVFLLYLPWLILSWDLLRRRLSWTEQPTLGAAFLRSLTAYSVGEMVPHPQAILLSLPFLLLYGLGLVYAARRSWRRWSGPDMLAFLLAYTLAPIVAAWLVGLWRTPVYLERYLIPVQVGYLLAVALGLLAVAGARPRRVARGAAAALLLLLVALNGWVLFHHYVDPLYAKPDWRAVARTVDAFGLPGDAVVVTGDGGEKVFQYYYRGDLPVYHTFNTPVPTEAEARKIMAGIAGSHSRIWYVPYGAPIDAALERWLAGHAFPVWQRWLGRKRLALYGGSAARTDRQETVNSTFTGSPQALTLLEVALPAGATEAGDLLPLGLTWQSASELTRDYQLSLRLTNGAGDLFTQSDWPPLPAMPPARPVTDRRAMWLPPDIPPGAYRLQLLLYDPASGQALGSPVAIDNVAVSPAGLVVPPDALPLSNPTDRPLGDISLVGYALPDTVRPGEEMWAWLYWQARQTPPPGAVLSLSLEAAGPAGDPATPAYRLPLAGSVGSLASWQPGQVRRAVYHLPTDRRLPTGQAFLRAALLRQGETIAEQELASVDLEGRDRQFDLPEIAHPSRVTLGRPPLVVLLGYDLPAPAPEPGRNWPVTLYWQALADIPASYTVFVQLLDAQGRVVAQVDRLPARGEAPTTTWLPGEILTDPHALELPADLSPGPYRLIAGLYRADTGARLPVSAGSDFVELQPVTVK